MSSRKHGTGADFKLTSLAEVFTEGVIKTDSEPWIMRSASALPHMLFNKRCETAGASRAGAESMTSHTMKKRTAVLHLLRQVGF